ncbi:MAG: hypothetical protein LQ340_001083 [Diploschistes diacapsis]|nr:MAG: hypothetical protein LQ340_001083 [Diploschistes diacapsis]
MALLQVFHTLVVVVTLVGSLTEAVVFRPNAIYVASGQYGKPTWRGSLVTPDLSHLPANQIKDQVERLARDAWDRAYESSTTFRIPDGENFAMAALWVPEKRKVHFGTQPKGNYLTTLKKSPPPGLTSRDVDPNIHAELYAYSNAMADGALPGPGSYMGVVGRMYDSKGTRIALHVPILNQAHPTRIQVISHRLIRNQRTRTQVHRFQATRAQPTTVQPPTVLAVF